MLEKQDSCLNCSKTLRLEKYSAIKDGYVYNCLNINCNCYKKRKEFSAENKVFLRTKSNIIQNIEDINTVLL